MGGRTTLSFSMRLNRPMLMIAVVSEGLRLACLDASRADYRLIEAHDPLSVQELLSKLSPRLMVIEWGVWGDCRDGLPMALDRCNGVRVIVLGNLPGPAGEIDLYLAGVRAVCCADIDAPQLARVIAAVDRGETWMRRALVPQLIERLGPRQPKRRIAPPKISGALSGMTAREAEVARLVADGCSNKQIARRLDISERTVKFHLSALFRKTGVDDRLMLALRMASHGDAIPPAALALAGENAPATSCGLSPVRQLA